MSLAIGAAVACFNPRPREGATYREEDIRVLSEFQSTPP